MRVSGAVTDAIPGTLLPAPVRHTSAAEAAGRGAWTNSGLTGDTTATLKSRRKSVDHYTDGLSQVYAPSMNRMTNSFTVAVSRLSMRCSSCGSRDSTKAVCFCLYMRRQANPPGKKSAGEPRPRYMLQSWSTRCCPWDDGAVPGMYAW